MCACANGPDMRARMHAAIADTGARGHDRAGMATRGNAMTIHARTRADRPDMGTRAHAMLSDMRATPTPSISTSARWHRTQRARKV